jgi:hypothetical protein
VFLVLAAALLALGCASRAAETPDPYAARASGDGAAPRPYVFGWPFVDTSKLEPRGGTTRGTDVTLALAPSQAWQRLQAPDLSPQQRDHAAILALAGDYRSSFDFLEVVLYRPGEEPARPYRSWGTERIVVLEDRPAFVSLQQILVMFVEDDDGNVEGPFVQKHWRQDWRYEPRDRLDYLGGGRFGRRAVPADARRGAWSQTVYQVDDSPRYAAVGRWSHDAQHSVWQSDVSWRPLPRRESSVRDDYDVMAGSHRLTVLPAGWVHEQENEKLVLSEGEAPHSLARELGLDRYERIQDFDFSAADAYWQATAPFWAQVRTAWAERVASGEEFRVAKTCDGEPGFAASFRFADRIERGEVSPDDEAALRAEARRIVACLTAED